MHARYYSPNLGRFVSVDPIGGTIGSSQSWNRYSYVTNNPLGYVDPTGEYGRGAGFTDEQWEDFDEAQKKAADKMEKRAQKLEDKAQKKEEKDKTGAANRLRAEANNLRQGVEVLRSDGSDGHVAFGISKFVMTDMGGNENWAAGTFVCSPEIWVNLDHANWSDPYKAARTAGHESLHNIGLYDEPVGPGEKGYKRGSPGQIKRFNEIKKEKHFHVITPELLMDKIFP